jgi:tetratricopeptide (TPR) repeat protein
MATKTGSPRFVKTLVLLLICFTTFYVPAQQRTTDSLWKVVSTRKNDTLKVDALRRLAFQYVNLGKLDSALVIAKKSMRIADSLKYKKGLADSYNIYGIVNSIRGQYSVAQDNFLKALKINEELGMERNISRCLSNLGIAHMYMKNHEKSLQYFRRALALNLKRGDTEGLGQNLLNIALQYRNLHNYDTSLYYYRRALSLNRSSGMKAPLLTTF